MPHDPEGQKPPENEKQESFVRLSHYFRRADIRFEKERNQTVIRFTAKDLEEYIAVKILIECTGILPYENDDTLTLTIDNKWDIVMLIEMGIIDVESLFIEEREVLEKVMDDEIADMITQKGKFPELRPIPELFKKATDRNASIFEDMTELPESDDQEYRNFRGAPLTLFE